MVATAAPPFNKINDVDMATVNGLSLPSALVDREKGLEGGLPIDIAQWLWGAAIYGQPGKGIATRLGLVTAPQSIVLWAFDCPSVTPLEMISKQSKGSSRRRGWIVMERGIKAEELI
ncbi:uncharacterized protein KY384_003264 [Bacidia gigantensis]|uniref:uncharacterized protein n=1 Tax=Bacidia gigantensis TaxID=2732470 RepID=UPI001D04F1C9|nr:uncharacterized protein KY384_003264 [Bacidia gigantensis]KAG8531633.1 hypothetical protein KY384_003264 [Bacidia gigantensis]